MCILLINGGMLQTCFCPVVTTHKRTLYIVRFTKNGRQTRCTSPHYLLSISDEMCIFGIYTCFIFQMARNVNFFPILPFRVCKQKKESIERTLFAQKLCRRKIFFPDEKNSFSFPSCPSRSRSFDRKKVLRNNFFCLSTLLSLSKMCPTL